MATPLALFPMAARSSIEDGAVLALGRRTAWTFRLAVAATGSALSLVLETSPTGEEGTWSVRHTVTDPAAGVTTVKSADADGGSTVVIPATDEFLRARVASLTGTWTFGLEATAPFFNAKAQDDLDLLAEEVRTSSEVERLAARAEDDVLAHLTVPERGAAVGGTGDIWRPVIGVLLGRRPWTPPLLETDVAGAERRADAARGRTVDFAAELTGAAEAIRAEIVLQVEHLHRKARLAASAEPSALVTLRGLGTYPDGFGQRLAPYRSAAGGLVWRGR